MHFEPHVLQWFYMICAIISPPLLAKENEIVPKTKQIIAQGASSPADERFNKMAIFKIVAKKKRSPPSRPVSLDGLSSLLKENHFWQEGSQLKRQIQPAKREFKCRQRDADVVTCFSDGRFYQFAGSLDSLDADSLSGVGGSPRPKKKRFIFKSWRSKGDKKGRAADTVSEDKKAESVPKSCYGFLAQKVTPQKLYKSNVGKPTGGNLEIDLRESNEPNINVSKGKEPSDQTATGHKEKRMAASLKRRTHPKKMRGRLSRHLPARRARSKQMSGLVGCSTEDPCTTKSCTTPCPTTTCSTTCPTTKTCRTTTCPTTCPTTKSCTTTCPTTTKPCRTTTCQTTPTCSTFCWSRCPPYEFTEQPLSTVTCSVRCPPEPTCPSCGQTSPCPCDKTATKKSNRHRKPSKVVRQGAGKQSGRIASTQVESPARRTHVKRLH